MQAVALPHVAAAVVAIAPDTTWALEWLEVSQKSPAGHTSPAQRFYAPQRFANPAAGDAVPAGLLVATAQEQCGYKVVVQTSDVRNAGTDAGAAVRKLRTGTCSIHVLLRRCVTFQRSRPHRQMLLNAPLQALISFAPVSLRAIMTYHKLPNADVFIELTGSDTRDTSGHLALQRSSSHANPFERGQQDCFTVSGHCVQAPTRLSVWCGRGGSELGWRVEWVSVQADGAPEPLMFRFADWVRKGAKLTACGAVSLAPACY